MNATLKDLQINSSLKKHIKNFPGVELIRFIKLLILISDMKSFMFLKSISKLNIWKSPDEIKYRNSDYSCVVSQLPKNEYVLVLKYYVN